ncbi:MAG: DMT family transporter [Verrucomicrobiales bacterium]
MGLNNGYLPHFEMISSRAKLIGFVALILGASGIGVAPIFVRLSEVGPIATGFYRLFFALPILWLWAASEKRKSKANLNKPLPDPWEKRNLWLFILSGSCFAGDLAFWHWSIKLTTVANSTLLTNFAPLFVVAGSRLFLKERVQPAVIVGMFIALAGGALLVRETLNFEPQHLTGDILALVTAGFYAGYILTATEIRKRFSTSVLMMFSACVTCPLLLIAALASRESFIPASLYGWGIILGLALISHVLGQGLIGYSLASLPASFSSVALLWQPVVAAVLAALLLNEPLTTLKIVGGAVVLLGILTASLFKTPR